MGKNKISTLDEDVRREYYPDGSLKSEIPCRDGEPHGLGRMYFENGSLETEILY